MIKFGDASSLSSRGSLSQAMSHEIEQFRLHQSVNFKEYKEQRSAFLEAQKNNDLNKACLQVFSPKIAVFAGSFNPFHKGHYNILQKAEKIFDKVIVAFGKNPEKSQPDYKVPSTIKNRQIEQYDGLLTDFIASIGTEVIVVRGLRNSTDFQYEQNQYRYIQELMPEIKIVNIFCDKEFEHISSSGIRTLQPYNRHQNYLLE